MLPPIEMKMPQIFSNISKIDSKTLPIMSILLLRNSSLIGSKHLFGAFLLENLRDEYF
jgi:hypothetical protein